jgi:hypothetical protein
MVAATLGRMTRLALVAGLVSSCASSETRARTRSEEREAGSSLRDAGNLHDAGARDAESRCSFTPCGGDLVGNWTIRHVCLASVGVRNCPTANLEPKDVVVTGSFSFGTDGGLTFDIRSSGTWEGLIPPSCVAGTNCASIAQSLYQANAPPASCASDGDGGCACSSPVTPVQMATMPYTVSGNVTANMSYCVRDGMLKLQNAGGTVFVASR